MRNSSVLLCASLMQAAAFHACWLLTARRQRRFERVSRAQLTSLRYHTHVDYHITATASGDKLDLFQSDWLMLLELAHKYDFDPDGGMDFYLYETPEIVPAPISHAIANALRSAARYLPDRTIGVLVSQKAGELF